MKLQFNSLAGSRVYMVGIKGTGMSALAELLVSEGAEVSGSDIPETFYTDEILKKHAIPVYGGFASSNLPENVDLLIYSSAYNPETHPELRAARSRNYEMLEYPVALAQYSNNLPLAAVSGVHGKTSTTAMVALLVRDLELPGQVLAGSALGNFSGSAVYNGGKDFFVAETCEYRRHFLNFNPKQLLITSIEPDHLDYFKDGNDIQLAFEEFFAKVVEDGSLIYCFDDPGVRSVAGTRPEIQHIPYGYESPGDYGITAHWLSEGCQHFTLRGFNTTFALAYPGAHSILNATAALALSADITGNRGNKSFHEKMANSLRHYSGARRRSELVAEIQGIRIIDDYAHHPTAIRSTLAGFKEFFPGRRLIVDFMPHTYSRTSALLKDFASCFNNADMLILNDIYASAREKNLHGIRGIDLYRESTLVHPNVRYIENFEEAACFVRDTIEGTDIFVTMGAGNNWQIGTRVAELLGGKK